jgi:hypothetical protein
VPSSSEEKRLVAGRYRLRSVLGSGSMGTVWSAYDEFLHRQVAVKEMKVPPGIPTSQADELRERTLREARAIAVLSHPNVIILHDVARENDQPFVVMELLPSRSLAHILRDHGPLTVEQAAAMGIAVSSALEAAHAAGITHRDVKPGNVLVASDGRIKLTDFGIARNVSEATMTRTGIMLGSPAYIAPEVASGGAVTPAADLWGLGATLFAAVEGAPPYDADGDPLETVGKVVNGKVPKPKAGPLADVISALMRKEPGKRITLREVRYRLYPLQTKTPLDLFGPELFRTPDGKKTSAQPDATDTQVIKTVLPEKVDKAEAKAEASVELAADPGPLPFLRPPAPAPAPVTPPAATVFVPAPPLRPGRRGARATAMLVAVAILLFLVSAGAGFALARTVGGQSLLPPDAEPGTTSNGPTEVPPPELVRQSGDANVATGVKGGQFGLDVPKGWLKFVAPHSTRLGASTVVQYVSEDGRRSIRLERLVGYFGEYTSDSQFVEWLKQTYPADAFQLYGPAPLDGGKGTTLTYRTVERGSPAEGGDGSVTRVTFVNLYKAGTSLWVFSVTAPAEQEDAARRDVFDRVAPTLSIND